MGPGFEEKTGSTGWLRAILVAAVCILLGYVGRLAVDFLIPGQVPFVTFYPAVMAASLIAGYRSGLIAVIGATPFAIFAFNGQYPIMTTVVWLVLASVVALGCGLAHDLRARLKTERDELARTKQKLELVISEQAHRAKNTFAILNALAAQSAKDAANVEEYRDRLIERVRALSSAYSLMSSAEPDAPLALDKLAELALAPFSSFGDRLNIAGGPPVNVAPSTAIPIALCLHELATNAVKYGALSAPDGRVYCAWSERSPGAYSLLWTEAGGPKVAKQRSPGFGSRLISAALNGVPGGSAVHKFEPDGVLCELAFNGA
ncbi:MAG TPA: HWE histidine kinase domain-containing protein [Hyphomonadaceae bacterium]|nr:HWE histidine kinase domain-containing protein [Hyphomonadaceae bacterium]